LLNEAMKTVQVQYEARGKSKIFETLKDFLASGSTGALSSYHDAAVMLGMSDAAVKTLIHRLRQQYSIALRHEVARTIADPTAIDEEIHLLCEALVAAEGHLAQ
jgi:biotin operon repressor